MGFAIEKLGQWTEGPEFKVEAERTKAYAQATNDPIPAHLSGEVAPPVFAVVPIWDTIAGGDGRASSPARGAHARGARRAGHAPGQADHPGHGAQLEGRAGGHPREAERHDASS